jgi:hypothetical protein
MNPQIDNGFRNLTLERWRELARREPALRAAARRWLFAALVSSLRRAVEWRSDVLSVQTTLSGTNSLARFEHTVLEKISRWRLGDAIDPASNDESLRQVTPARAHSVLRGAGPLRRVGSAARAGSDYPSIQGGRRRGRWASRT